MSGIVVAASPSQVAPTEVEDSKSEPTRFGRFELIERIGAGGMAEVFLAAVRGPEGFRREIVVKRVLPQLSSRARFTQMFVNEAKISALLAHPNIVQIFEFGESEGAYFIAMESVRGLTLRAVLTKLREQGRVMPVVAAAEISRDVLVALDYAHNLRAADGHPLEIVHRDISPSNIMLAETGAVKVLDFGIARAADYISADEGKVVKGKIAYLAPEQVTCGDIDQRADVFAMGCVLFELLTGRVMFRSQNDLQKKIDLLAQPSQPPSAWNGEVPRALDAIVLKAVARDLGERYASAADMLVDIDNYLAAFRSSSRSVLRLVRSLADGAQPDDTGATGSHTGTPDASGTSGSAGSARQAPRAGTRTGSTPSLSPATPLPGVIAGAGSATASAPARRAGSGQAVRLAASAERNRFAQSAWRRQLAIAVMVVLGLGVIAGAVAGVRAVLPHVAHALTRAPVPPPKPADPFVLITFQSTPPGARIRAAGGHLLGLTPATLPVPPGHAAVSFQIEKDGFQPGTASPIPDEDKTVDVELHVVRPPVERPARRKSAKKPVAQAAE